MDASMAVIDSRPTVEAVYRAEADRLWRAVLAWSGEHDVASEAVAEAFAQLLKRGADVRNPAAWTWRTAFRVAAGAMKTRRAARDRAFPGSLGSLGHAEPASPDRYGDPDLLAALRRLSDGQRAAVVLFYYADLPIAAIADRLGSNQLAVRTNLSRGRRRLRQLLGDDHG
jgi:RNA polymerase sigma-70 factor (ECF subfamily)